MRTLIRLALIVGVLSLLVGIGLYVQHMDEVHAWLRPLGRKHHAADEVKVADEVVLKQRTTAVLPGLDGTVKVRVDDIKHGKTADVAVIGPESIVLASKKSARVGDRIAFTHDSREYAVEVIRYDDKIGAGDLAAFRIIALPKDGQVYAQGKDDASDAQVQKAPSKTYTYILKETRTIGRPKGLGAATVQYLMFAADGKTVGSESGWWDVATGEEAEEDPNSKLPERPRLPEGVEARAVSSDGKYAASAPKGQDKNDEERDEKAWVVTVVDAKTNKTLARLDHTDQVSAIAFSLDGSKLAVGTKYIVSHAGFGYHRGTITLWEMPSGKKISSARKLDPVFALAFSPDGTALASGHWRGDIKLWEQVKDAPREAKVKPASAGKAPPNIQGVWKIEGHPDVQQCVIRQVDKSRHLVCLDGKILEAPIDLFIPLDYDPAQPHKIFFPVLSRRLDRLGWGSCSAHGAEVTIRFADKEILLTRISTDLDAEMQADFEYVTDRSTTEEGRAAFESLKKRNRNASSALMRGGGPYVIGFPAGAKIEDADAKDLTIIHGIGKLWLAKTQLKDDDLKFVASFKRLQSLNVSHTPVTDAGLKHLNGLKRLLDLNLEHTKVTDAGLKALVDLPSLVSLNLNGCDQVTQAGIAAVFRALPKLPALTIGGGYQHRDAKRPLISLWPEKPRSDQWNKALATARQASGVDLFLNCNDITSGNDLQQLKEFADLKAPVIALYLGAPTEAGLKHLAMFSGLELLSMNRGSIGEKEMQAIARLPKVKHLLLMNCEVSDEGMKHLAGITQLESVCLFGTTITDAGIMNLAGSNLRRVGLGSPEQEKAIRKILPKLEAWRFPEQYFFKRAEIGPY